MPVDRKLQKFHIIRWLDSKGVQDKAKIFRQLTVVGFENNELRFLCVDNKFMRVTKFLDLFK